MADLKPYCGIAKLRKGQRLGTPAECTKLKQIRYYGLEKVNREDLISAEKGIEEIRKGLLFKIGKLSGKRNALVKKNKSNKDPVIKAELTAQFKAVTKELNDIIKEINKLPAPTREGVPDFGEDEPKVFDRKVPSKMKLVTTSIITAGKQQVALLRPQPKIQHRGDKKRIARLRPRFEANARQLLKEKNLINSRTPMASVRTVPKGPKSPPRRILRVPQNTPLVAGHEIQQDKLDAEELFQNYKERLKDTKDIQAIRRIAAAERAKQVKKEKERKDAKDAETARRQAKFAEEFRRDEQSSEEDDPSSSKFNIKSLTKKDREQLEFDKFEDPDFSPLVSGESLKKRFTLPKKKKQKCSECSEEESEEEFVPLSAAEQKARSKKFNKGTPKAKKLKLLMAEAEQVLEELEASWMNENPDENEAPAIDEILREQGLVGDDLDEALIWTELFSMTKPERNRLSMNEINMWQKLVDGAFQLRF